MMDYQISIDQFLELLLVITFTVKNTFIGDGVTGIKTTSSEPETVGVEILS